MEFSKETRIEEVYLEGHQNYVTSRVVSMVEIAQGARVDKEGTCSGTEPQGTPKLRGQGERKE